jgi:hypothetical protein
MWRRRKLGHTTGTTSHNHGFNLTDFVAPQHPEEEDITTFVDRVSDDRRRTYRTEVPVAPPSPIKKITRQRLDDELKAQSSSDPTPHEPSSAFNYERYDVAAAVNDYENEPDPEPIPCQPKFIQPTVRGEIPFFGQRN